MYKVIITGKGIQKIQKYISKYREYYQELYLDSWIWSEDMIIEKYFEEAENRYKEIRNLLEFQLSKPLPSYPNNEAIIHWRTKILLVSFREENDTRIITDIDIR